jgi:hypothetical protein
VLLAQNWLSYVEPLTKTTCSPKSEKPVIAAAVVVEFELVNPAGENEDVGVMKKLPTEEEFDDVAFQAEEVSVVMAQVIAARVDGSEVVSAI